MLCIVKIICTVVSLIDSWEAFETERIKYILLQYCYDDIKLLLACSYRNQQIKCK